MSTTASKLRRAHIPQDTILAITDSLTSLSTYIVSPGHAFATIYTSSKSERVLITNVSGASGSDFIVTRGVAGTVPLPWPSGACVCIEEVIAGSVCPDYDGQDTTCNPASVFGALTVGKGLVLDQTDPLAPVLSLEATGLVTTNVCGAEFDTCGRLVSAPLNWPATCLPVFDPCCDVGSGVPSTVDLCALPFAPQGGGIVTATNICGAVAQLEDAINAASSGGTGAVATIVAGDCIALGGTATAPTISVAPSGITAGSYAGFAVNECGQITSYTPVASSGITLVGAGAISVGFNNGTQTYTISISPASTADCGCVLLVDDGDAIDQASWNLIPGEAAVTWDALQAWATAKGL